MTPQAFTQAIALAWSAFSRSMTPPENPDEPEVEWRQALLWAAATAPTRGENQ